MQWIRTAIFFLGLSALFFSGCGGGRVQKLYQSEYSCDPLPADHRDGGGPAFLLNEAPFSSRPADLGIDASSLTTSHLIVQGKTLVVLNFSVTTFEDRFGGPWVHPVKVIAPAFQDLRSTTIAATSAGSSTQNAVGPDQSDPVWGQSHPDWFEGTDSESDHYLKSYASVVVDFGIPFVVTNVVPPVMVWEDQQLIADLQDFLQTDENPCNEDLCIGSTQDGRNVLTSDFEKMECMRRTVFLREDLTFEPSLHLAAAHSRILDAAEFVLNQYYTAKASNPGLQWNQIWSIGSSKRGHQERFLAAIDERIQGVLVSAADISNYPQFFAAQESLWTAGFTTEGQLPSNLLDSPFAEQYYQAFDMFRWKPEVMGDVEFVLAVGTNDPLYPLGSSLFYSNSWPDSSHMLLVPNYRHGHGSVEHVAGFRAMLSQGIDGTIWPTVSAQYDPSTKTIRATTSGGALQSVDLWCASDLGSTNTTIEAYDESCRSIEIDPVDDGDMREVVWSSTPMTQVGTGLFEVEAPLSHIEYTACFVRILSDDEKPATSLPLLSAPLCQASGL